MVGSIKKGELTLVLARNDELEPAMGRDRPKRLFAGSLCKIALVNFMARG
jgi:hypothetical protein